MSNQIFIKKTLIISIILMTTIAIGCLSSTQNDAGLPSPIETTGKPVSVAPTGQTPISQIEQTPNTISQTGQTPITIPTECVVPAKGAGTYLRTISDENQSLSGIVINVTPIAVQCSLREPTYTNITNSTGWSYLGSLPANYEFEVSLTYKKKDYNLSILQQPLFKTYATLQLPSGNLTIKLCSPGPEEICTPYN